MEDLSLGPFLVPGFAVHAVVTVLPAFVVMALILRRDREFRRELVDVLSTALLIYVLLWKLGPLYAEPAAVLEEPRLLLFGRGGLPGVLVGAFVAAGYLLIAAIRRGLFSRRGVFSLGVFAAVAVLAYTGGAYAAAWDTDGTDGGGAGAPGAPEFTLETLENEAFSLRDARGTPVVLNFWATWCGPCEAEIPTKKRLAEELESRVELIGVNLTTGEAGPEAVRDYVEEHEIAYPVVLDTDGRVQQRYNVRGTPTTYIIDAEGQVVHRFMGAMSFGEMMRRLAPLLEAEEG